MRINSPNWYPCYLNPTFEEVLELARSRWDTCRILAEQPHRKLVETSGDLVIASGLGNTHSSIMDAYARSKNGLRIVDGRTKYSHSVPHLTPYILYHEQRVAYFNLEDCSGSSRARSPKWEEYFFSGHVEILKDLIRESDLAL